MKAARACMLIVLFWTGLANSAGFDSSFQVRIGYANADSLLDVYVSSPRSVVIPLDDIPIVLPPPVADFILSNNGDGTFTLVAQIQAAARAAARIPRSMTRTRGKLRRC